MSCIANLLLAILFATVSARPREDCSDDFLQSPTITNWGNWGNFQYCSPGYVVTGFQLKVETKEANNDDIALNGIRFSCGRPYHLDYIEMGRITSSYSRYGTARDWAHCEGYAVGFQMKSQKSQGRNADDVAAVNLRMICDNEKVFEGYNEQGDFYNDSEYTEPMICPNGTAVCGLQTQVESVQLVGDDTSLNNIRLKCCTLHFFPTTTEVPTIKTSTTQEPQDASSTQQEIVFTNKAVKSSQNICKY